MNLMPCVLPVLMLKLRAFGDASKRLPYIAGVMTSFMGLATCSVLLGTGLSQMGFEGYRVALVVVCFLFSAQLFGLWHMPSFGVSGNLGPFAMGCLTVALGSSCSVPFLAPVMGYTLSCTALETYLLFGALGVGFCSPFIIPGFRLPGFLRHYPSFVELVCGVAMLGVGLWLCLTLDAQQISASLGMCGGIMLFLIGLQSKIAQTTKAVIGFLAGSSVVSSILVLVSIQPATVTEQTWPVSGPRVIFVTADWCMNCKAMKPTLQSSEAEQLLRSNGILEVTYLDYTDQPDNISRFLRSNGVRDVPLCLIENKHGNVTILTGLWKPSDVIKALNMKQIENSRPDWLPNGL